MVQHRVNAWELSSAGLRSVGCDQVLPDCEGRKFPRTISSHIGYSVLSTWVDLVDRRSRDAAAFTARVVSMDKVGFKPYSSIVAFLSTSISQLFFCSLRDPDTHFCLLELRGLRRICEILTKTLPSLEQELLFPKRFVGMLEEHTEDWLLHRYWICGDDFDAARDEAELMDYHNELTFGEVELAAERLCQRSEGGWPDD
jgi:hypothetical protein